MLKQIVKGLIGGSTNGGGGMRLRGIEYKSELRGGVRVLVPKNRTERDLAAITLQQGEDLNKLMDIAKDWGPEFDKLKEEVEDVKKQVKDLTDSGGGVPKGDSGSGTEEK